MGSDFGTVMRLASLVIDVIEAGKIAQIVRYSRFSQCFSNASQGLNFQEGRHILWGVTSRQHRCQLVLVPRRFRGVLSAIKACFSPVPAKKRSRRDEILNPAVGEIPYLGNHVLPECLCMVISFHGLLSGFNCFWNFANSLEHKSAVKLSLRFVATFIAVR
jgi:hypothetical protein